MCNVCEGAAVSDSGVEASNPNSEPVAPALSAYTDFRRYLKDFYDYKRACDKDALRPYSYGHFSAAADIKSPNYLKMIMEGKRNLSKAMVAKFAKALQLNKADIEEFEALVFYGQAVDPLERNGFLKGLSEIRVKRKIQNGEIDGTAWDQAPSWVAFALKALAEQRGVEFSPQNLRQLLGGRATIDEIQRTLEKMIAKGDLVRDEATGQVSRGLKPAQATEELPPAAVRKLQAELIYLGMESLFEGDPKEREFGSVTLALTEEEFKQLKFELRHLRKRFYKDSLINRERTPGDRVYQFNLQLFPISENS